MIILGIMRLIGRRRRLRKRSRLVRGANFSWVKKFEILLILFGGGLILLAFFVLKTVNKFISDEYDGTVVTIYRTMTGIANGVVIVIFTEIYKKACLKIVHLENHKFESHYESSYIFKRCVFDFLLSYINLGYYAFYVQDFKLLANNFITIIITKNLLFTIKVSLSDEFYSLLRLPAKKTDV